MTKQKVKKSDIIRELEEMRDLRVKQMRNHNAKVLNDAYISYIDSKYGQTIEEIATNVAKYCDKLFNLSAEMAKDEELQIYAINSHKYFLEQIRTKDGFIDYLIKNSYQCGKFSDLNRLGSNKVATLKDEWYKLITNVKSLTVKQAIKYLNDLGIKLQCIEQPQEETALMIKDINLNILGINTDTE